MTYQFLEFRSVMNLRKVHLQKGADMLVDGHHFVCPGLGGSQRAALKELEGQGLAMIYLVFLLKT